MDLLWLCPYSFVHYHNLSVCLYLCDLEISKQRKDSCVLQWSRSCFFTLFLYEILFNVTGRFPPTGNLPLWGIVLLVCSILLGLLQARKHFALQRLSIVLLSAFVVEWFVWILVGFPFNFPSTQPLNLMAEVFNVTTKLLLPLGYATGLAVQKRTSLSNWEILPVKLTSAAVLFTALRKFWRFRLR